MSANLIFLRHKETNMEKLKGTDIWNAFQEKLKDDTLTEADFTTEMCTYLQPLLCGEHSASRRQKFLDAPYDVYAGANKISVVSHCPDDDYRFDFSCDGTSCKLAFIECITLPVLGMDVVPYSKFMPLDKKELFIRREKEISQLVHYYLKFKELLGKEKALTIFYDGKGEYLCARSWVPFYSDRLSYVAYSVWYECRINGENVVIQEFQESKCRVMIYNHIWRSIYFVAGHLKPAIGYVEYMELFESIWKDRAANAGWEIDFIYEDEHTLLIFSRSSTDIAKNSR